jgi:hypothetical protein
MNQKFTVEVYGENLETFYGASPDLVVYVNGHTDTTAPSATSKGEYYLRYSDLSARTSAGNYGLVLSWSSHTKDTGYGLIFG